MGISKTSDNIQIKMKLPNPSQEPPASSESQNEDLKDMDAVYLYNQLREPKFRIWVYND